MEERTSGERRGRKLRGGEKVKEHEMRKERRSDGHTERESASKG